MSVPSAPTSGVFPSRKTVLRCLRGFMRTPGTNYSHTVAIAVKASSSKEEKLTKRFRVYAWGSADGFRCGIPSRGREFKTPEIVELRSHSNSNEAPTYLRKRLAKMEKIA
eukprot:1344212-Amorphochlora_amoeboformis.AAC.1